MTITGIQKMYCINLKKCKPGPKEIRNYGTYAYVFAFATLDFGTNFNLELDCRSDHVHWETTWT